MAPTLDSRQLIELGFQHLLEYIALHLPNRSLGFRRGAAFSHKWKTEGKESQSKISALTGADKGITRPTTALQLTRRNLARYAARQHDIAKLRI